MAPKRAWNETQNETRAGFVPGFVPRCDRCLLGHFGAHLAGIGCSPWVENHFDMSRGGPGAGRGHMGVALTLKP